MQNLNYIQNFQGMREIMIDGDKVEAPSEETSNYPSLCTQKSGENLDIPGKGNFEADKGISNDNKQAENSASVEEFSQRIHGIERFIKHSLANSGFENAFKEILTICKVQANKDQISELVRMFEIAYSNMLNREAKGKNEGLNGVDEKFMNYLIPPIENSSFKMPSYKNPNHKPENSKNGKPMLNAESERIPTLLREDMDIEKILITWFKKCKPAILQILPQDIKLKLISTINDYENVREEILKSGGDISSVDEIISRFKKHLNMPIEDKARIELKGNFEEKCNIGLHDIYMFYCKQFGPNGGTSPTFELIEKNNETMSLGKFFRFLREFDLMDTNKRTDRKILQRKLVQKLFLKFTNFKYEINESQFLKFLELLSEFYFDVEYDSINGTSYRSLTPYEKKLLLYKDIGCYDIAIYSKKCKGVIHHFGVSPTRIPDNDLSKNYKFNPEKYEAQKLQVQEWKKSREVSLESEPKKAKSLTNSRSGPLTQSKTSKTYSIESLPEPSYSSTHQGVKSSFTFQNLNEIVPEMIPGIQEELDLKNLISDKNSDDDEYLQKNYPLGETRRSPTKGSEGKLLMYREKRLKNNDKLARKMSEQILRRATELSQEQNKSERRRLYGFKL
ncbi:unnamed protein product [Blepharisma stoltei]|uniref:Uncharacterized protein n=1 Tax=Blepharisma stoltei TaxID=1481888 RepID=A0AAU9KFC9_9CILI|nr:unnamed protein product [Blepharisma stoltei]